MSQLSVDERSSSKNFSKIRAYLASSNCWIIETKEIRDVTRAPPKGPKPGSIRHELWSGDRRRQNSFLCYVYGGEGRGCKGSFFSRNVVFSKFSKFLDFCQQQQMIHTPARASTRHPAKLRSQGLTCGLATVEHRLHCYVDHNNSGCCSGYEPAQGKAPGHYNNLSNLYATVSFREMSRAFPIKFTSRYT